jgi:S-DNA-T family DNA segregation ATPase FtsK/SpoIIIE
MSGRRRTRRSEDGSQAHLGWSALRARTRDVLAQLLRYANDLAALLLMALALLTLLGLAGLTHGKLIDPWVRFLKYWTGWGAVFLALGGVGAAIIILRRRLGASRKLLWSQIVALEVGLIGFMGLFSIMDGASLPRAEGGFGGGVIGWALATLLGEVLGEWGRMVALAVVAAAGTAYALYGALARFVFTWLPQREADVGSWHFETPEEPGEILAQEAASPEVKPAMSRLPRQFRKNFKLPQAEEGERAAQIERDEQLPPLDVLESGGWSGMSIKEINLAAGIIEKTLSDFGLNVRVVDFRTGPSVTQFAVEPGFQEQASANGGRRRQKVRVSQIAALADDLALALSAPSLRIEAPVPGKAYVGVEVPNREPALVRLRPVLESEAFQAIDSPLAITLGRDVAGKPIVADLAAMPHLLIAGTTGSGKSVCITSLACCLIANNAPHDLRLVMIDPKKVELVRFNGLPHLLGKVECELERIVGVLRWCTLEMDRRYKLLEGAGARDIWEYNRRRRRKGIQDRLPQIVVLIDELADLMMKTPEQTEKSLVRLAQMARATGIHLVVATQRPSTDIVTGLIKANFPARIAFAVASGVDSRVILDGPGAETLLGQGDMLFLSQEAATGVRLQGVFVTDLEVERLVDYWQKAMAGQDWQAEQAPWEDLLERQSLLADRDEVLGEAIKVVQQAGYASASMLQRQLRVGYPRAARLMDDLEDLGIIGGPQKGGRTREVLIDKDSDPLGKKPSE